MLNVIFFSLKKLHYIFFFFFSFSISNSRVSYHTHYYKPFLSCLCLPFLCPVHSSIASPPPQVVDRLKAEVLSAMNSSYVPADWPKVTDHDYDHNHDHDHDHDHDHNHDHDLPDSRDQQGCGSEALLAVHTHQGGAALAKPEELRGLEDLLT